MKFKIGDRVINLRRFKATVVGFHKETGDLILKDEDGMQWLAIRKQCKKVKAEDEKPDILYEEVRA